MAIFHSYVSLLEGTEKKKSEKQRVSPGLPTPSTPDARPSRLLEWLGVEKLFVNTNRLQLQPLRL